MFKHRGSRREEEDYHHWHPRERIKSEEHLKRKIHRKLELTDSRSCQNEV